VQKPESSKGFGEYPVGSPLQARFTAVPSQAQPGSKISHSAPGLGKQVPLAAQASFVGNPQISPVEHSLSLLHGPPASSLGQGDATGQ